MENTIPILLLGEKPEIARVFEEPLYSKKKYALIQLAELGTEEEKHIANIGCHAPKVVLLPYRNKYAANICSLLSCLKKKFVQAKMVVYFYETPDEALLCHMEQQGVEAFFMFHEYKYLHDLFDTLLLPNRFTSELHHHLINKVCENKLLVQDTLDSLRQRLKKREVKMVEYLLQHPKATNKQMAAALNIELSTLEKHLKPFYRNMGVETKTQLLLLLEKMK